MSFYAQRMQAARDAAIKDEGSGFNRSFRLPPRVARDETLAQKIARLEGNAAYWNSIASDPREHPVRRRFAAAQVESIDADLAWMRNGVVL